MIINQLSSYFSGVAIKRLSLVEICSESYHQHEFNGVQGLRTMLGKENNVFPATFVYLDAVEEESFSCDGSVTWYDAREKHPKRTEYRLYYRANDVMDAAGVDDLLAVCKVSDENRLVIIVTRANTDAESQVLWLFGPPKENLGNFVVNTNTEATKVDFAGRYILEQAGIDAYAPAPEEYLEQMKRRFGNSFPTTRAFSKFARDTSEVDSRSDPDTAIIQWLEQEEALFRLFENHLFKDVLKKGFDTIDDFVTAAQSLTNRRKSRVGFAFENHLEQVFKDNDIRYTVKPETENKSKPDFVFPSIDYYLTRENAVVDSLVTVLGVKHTCKDRWRQVLAEANKVSRKHLITVEPSISTNQTNEMISNYLQLVVPRSLMRTYTTEQQKWLISLKDFIALTASRQEKLAELE
jgi:hypothetical protein